MALPVDGTDGSGLNELVWTSEDTSPSEIEAALLRLLMERTGDNRVHAPTRVFNLVVISDIQWRDETAERLERISAGNPARTILVTVDPERETLGGSAALVEDRDLPDEAEVRVRERVEINCGPEHAHRLGSIIRPLLASDIGTVVWSPHRNREAVDQMIPVADSFLIDSLAERDPAVAMGRAVALAESAEVIDLAWLRSTPWRERLAAAFDSQEWRAALKRISAVEVRIHPGSVIAALLYLGWLASRLEWDPSPIALDETGQGDGVAQSRFGEVSMKVVLDDTMPVPGLSGVSVATSDGLTVALDRGAGGLTASRSSGDESESQWSVLGASRGEDGILAQGVAHCLAGDPLFRPALAEARRMMA